MRIKGKNVLISFQTFLNEYKLNKINRHKKKKFSQT